MRAIIQRVATASVTINNQETRSIDKGYMILLGVGHNDSYDQADQLWRKIFNLRIFQDSSGKTNLNLSAVNGSVLIVSQFTLYANCRRGNRPSFVESAPPQLGERIYNYFIELARRDLQNVQTGDFGADMQVKLVNDGPFTITLDTDLL